MLLFFFNILFLDDIVCDRESINYCFLFEFLVRRDFCEFSECFIVFDDDVFFLEVIWVSVVFKGFFVFKLFIVFEVKGFFLDKFFKLTFFFKEVKDVWLIDELGFFIEVFFGIWLICFLWVLKECIFKVFDVFWVLDDVFLVLLFVDVKRVIIFVSLDKVENVEFMLFWVFGFLDLCGRDKYFVLELWF